MSWRQAFIAIVLIFTSFGISGAARSCDIALLVQNSTSFTITAVRYFNTDDKTWSENLLPGDLEPSASKRIRWKGDGEYRIWITQSNDPDKPRMIVVPDICKKSQIVVGQDKIVPR